MHPSHSHCTHWNPIPPPAFSLRTGRSCTSCSRPSCVHTRGSLPHAPTALSSHSHCTLTHVNTLITPSSQDCMHELLPDRRVFTHVARFLLMHPLHSYHTVTPIAPPYHHPLLSQDRLHELFPDHRVFTHVARFLMHPDNRLWAKITHTFLANLGHYPHRLGVQIRSPDGIDLPVANRILRCGVHAQYLPLTQPYPEDPSMATPTLGYPGGGAGGGGGDAETYRSFRTMGVFVSSLNIRHMLDLESHYAQHLTIGNTFVSFWSLTNEGRETRQEEQLIDAVMDMWILSFSDRLLITHISSFGRTAVGLAGTDAYSMAITVIKMRGIDWRNSTGPVCERVSSEPCDSLGGAVKYSGCRWDYNRSGISQPYQRPLGFGACPGMNFGLQDHYPLVNLPPT
ncbi:unnamed protein product [Closterium sp. NIES-54]